MCSCHLLPPGLAWSCDAPGNKERWHQQDSAAFASALLKTPEHTKEVSSSAHSSSDGTLSRKGAKATGGKS